MQEGMRAALICAAPGSGRGLRALSPRALTSLLCAGAFAPLIPAVVGISGVVVLAGFEVLAALGTHVLKPADLLHPPDVQLEMRPPCSQ
jgi:hypothetical protein